MLTAVNSGSRQDRSVGKMVLSKKGPKTKKEKKMQVLDPRASLALRRSTKQFFSRLIRIQQQNINNFIVHNGYSFD